MNDYKIINNAYCEPPANFQFQNVSFLGWPFSDKVLILQTDIRRYIIYHISVLTFGRCILRFERLLFHQEHFRASKQVSIIFHNCNLILAY